MTATQQPVLASGTFTLAAGGTDPLTVRRLGFGSMRITGAGIWGDHPNDSSLGSVKHQPNLHRATMWLTLSARRGDECCPPSSSRPAERASTRARETA